MSYSIAPILHNRTVDDKLHKVQIRVIFDRKKYYAKTAFRLKSNQLSNGKVINHHLAKSINAALDMQRIEIETRMLELIKSGETAPDNIRDAVAGFMRSDALQDVLKNVIDHYRGRVSANTIHNYNVSVKKFIEFNPEIKVSECTSFKLGEFEQWMRGHKTGYNINTIAKYLQMIKSVLNKSAKMGMVEAKIFQDYRRPKSVQAVPVWLTEAEINAFSDVVFAVKDEHMMQAGYYFLLSCYTGYRISDAKRFNYSKSFVDGMIVIRADKNKRIVTMPVFPRLARVLEYCKEHPLSLSEQKTREHVRSLCKAAGIKKDVKFHSARHSFAMMLMANGFTIDEASELIGDTPLVTKVYARVHNKSLNEKILSRLS